MRDRLVAPLLNPERRMIFINGMADPNSGADMVELIRTSVSSPESSPSRASDTGRTWRCPRSWARRSWSSWGGAG